MIQVKMICVLVALMYTPQTLNNPDYQTPPAFCPDEVEPVCMKCHIGIPRTLCK